MLGFVIVIIIPSLGYDFSYLNNPENESSNGRTEIKALLNLCQKRASIRDSRLLPHSLLRDWICRIWLDVPTSRLRCPNTLEVHVLSMISRLDPPKYILISWSLFFDLNFLLFIYWSSFLDLSDLPSLDQSNEHSTRTQRAVLPFVEKWSHTFGSPRWSIWDIKILWWWI